MLQKQVQSNDLLETPGEKDITCDVCWDPLVKQLQAANFTEVTLESQESFLPAPNMRLSPSLKTPLGHSIQSAKL